MRKKRDTSDKKVDSELKLRNKDIDSSSTRSNSSNNLKSRNDTYYLNKSYNKTNEFEEDEFDSQNSDVLLDSDEDEGDINRIGNVPFDWYDKEDHIGYTVEGRKLIKELDSTRLGQLIFNSDNPDAWRTIVDPRNNRTIKLSDDDLRIIRRIRKGMYPSETYDPESVSVEFDNEEDKFPVSFELPPKSRFLPSKWEAIKVSKLVKLIKSGKIFTSEQRKLNEQKKLEEFEAVKDIWKDAIYDVDPTSAKRSLKHEIKPPKIDLPTNSESYNPPEEYLLNEEETKNWLETEPHERQCNYLPKKYDSLRVVPVYSNLIVERFTRCLQLLMCPRSVKLKMNVDPDSLLPELPSPSELGPFPSRPSVEYQFTDLNRSCLDCTGRFLAICSTDCVRVCDVMTGYCVLSLEFSEVHYILFHPKTPILAVSHGYEVTLLALELPNKCKYELDDEVDEYENAKKYLYMETEKSNWGPFKKGKYEGLTIKHSHQVLNMSFHPGGNYIVCVSPDSAESINQCVLHCIPKKSSMRIGNKISNNRIKLALFHPKEPKLIVSFTRNIRVYNLSTSGSNKLVNKLPDESKFTGVELPVSFDTNGTYLLVGDENGKLTLYDQEVSSFPYKSYNFENESIVKVDIHKKFPLVLVGYKNSVKCFHLSQKDDGEALFVPLNEIKVDGSLKDCLWHNVEPWMFTCTNKNSIMWV